MGSTRDAEVLALIAAAPELGTPDETDHFLNAMQFPTSRRCGACCSA